jgi:hypothetical protein
MMYVFYLTEESGYNFRVFSYFVVFFRVVRQYEKRKEANSGCSVGVGSWWRGGGGRELKKVDCGSDCLGVGGFR